jgi:hypothetical protein
MVELAFIYSSSCITTEEENFYSSKAMAKSHAAKVAHKKRRLRKLNTLPKHKTCHTHQFLSSHRGNSDPFNATQALKVTPRVHETLMFIQEVFIPTTFAPASQSWVRDFTCESYFKGQATSILNEPPSIGEILPYLTMIATRSKSQEYQHEALTAHLQIVQKAKEALSDPLADPGHLLLFTKALFSSAITQQDMDAARSHGLIFGYLLFQQIELTGSSSLAVGFVINSLFYLLELTHITLQKSIIDVGWVDPFVRHAARPVIDFLEPLHEKFEGYLDPCISNRRLRDSYRTMYHTFWLWYHQRQPSQEITREMLAGYCLIQHNVNQIKLINHFAYFREKLKDAHDLSARRVSYLVSQALLAIGLVTFLATFVANPKISMRYVWEKHILFLSQLRWLLTFRWRGGLVLAEEEFWGYRHALLWVYWIGATWEHREGLSDRYFSSRFRNTCRNMNLKTWGQVETVLDGFASTKLALPPPSGWVDIELELAWANHGSDDQR